MKKTIIWSAKILSVIVSTLGFIATVVAFAFAVYAIANQTHHGILVMSDRDGGFLLLLVEIPIVSMLVGVFGLVKTKIF